MGFRRWLTVLTCMTAAGIALSRPDDIVPVAARFIAPLLAQQQARSVDPGHALPDYIPDYIPGNHDLTFQGDDPVSLAAHAPDAEAAAAAPPTPVPPSNAGLAVVAETVETSEKPTATATETAAAVSPQPAAALAEQPAPVAAPAAAAIDPLAPEDGSKPVQVVTIEPDPTLPPQAPRVPLIPAKKFFGAAKAPAPLAARAIGSYARGCLAGGVALPVDGPAWQAMRLSRNRNWGHPRLVKLVERLALESQKSDGWPGLLVGDLSQPRGGPMLTGHASHQVGLDADVWLTPMPSQRLNKKQREELSATSMLDQTDIAVDPKVFTDGQVKLLKRAASYPDVERVLVHPAIKKALCEAAGPDRGWLGKVRPIGGHYYHFHIRIGCPPGSATCEPQKAPTGEDGCGKEVQEWLARLAPSKGPPVPKPPGYKPKPPKPPMTLAQLPQECTAVLESGPDGVDVPAEAKMDLRAIARAPAALRPHLRKVSSARK
jgi:penicillin-insensitive murein DD-endopeptidase